MLSLILFLYAVGMLYSWGVALILSHHDPYWPCTGKAENIKGMLAFTLLWPLFLGMIHTSGRP